MASQKKVSFIGSGRMAEAIIAGIVKKKIFSANRIYIADKDTEKAKILARKFKVNFCEDNNKALWSGNIIVLAVKPQNMVQVLEQIKEEIKASQLVISIAAGVTIGFLEKALKGCPVIRAMPNNPCLIGEGMTAVAAGKNAGSSDLKTARDIFECLGKAIVLKEKYFDAVTGLSGSGPAFVYEFIAALAEGGIKSGLERETAHQLAVQTILGSVMTLAETGKSPKELVEMVASPGGTTIEGLKLFEEAKFSQIVSDAVYAAAARSKRISADLGLVC
ncbi:MAG: pyrroline-5-carboxylate reductase [Candidatus Margulisiibacteriota bacterium]